MTHIAVKSSDMTPSRLLTNPTDKTVREAEKGRRDGVSP
jgi:hypothetical protein